jgi:hypothetical protein
MNYLSCKVHLVKSQLRGLYEIIPDLLLLSSYAIMILQTLHVLLFRVVSLIS